MSVDDLPEDDPHRRTDGVSDALVDAVGKVTEAFEWVERGRGRLYDFHQVMGHADRLFGQAADALADAGADAQAGDLREQLIGRNVLEGRWTFQIVEEFDAGYWADATALEAKIRGDLMGGRRHVSESEMKEERRTKGRRHHEARPEPGQ